MHYRLSKRLHTNAHEKISFDSLNMVTVPTQEIVPATSVNNEDSPFVLPAEPLITIRPSGAWAVVDWRELWAHRELFYFLVWRDFKVRYRQTILGAGWVVLQPILTTLVFTIFLGKLVQVPSGGVAYPIFAYSGLLLWTFLSNAVSSSSHSLVASSHMISKVYFARLVIPGAAIMVRLIDFLIAAMILAGLMVYYDVQLTWNLVVLPLMVIELTALALGVGIWASALNVRYRDVGTVLPVALQLWMFASPIVYPSSLVPERWQWIYALNPLSGIVDGFRSSIFGLKFDLRGIAISVVVTLAIFIVSLRAFRRMEDSFADDV